LELIERFWEALRSRQVPNLGWWSYLLVALMVVVEGPVSTMLGGSAASAGFLYLPWVYVAAVTGNLVADAGWYLLGRTGKIDWLLHYAAWTGLRQEDVERTLRELHIHAWKVLLVSKLSNILVVPILVTTGLARVSWRHWLPASVLGTIITTGILTLVGYYSAEAAKRVHHGLECITLASPMAFTLIVLWLVRRRQRRPRQEYPRL
jgi:membrane protein DedA with SNARE-associated domain